MTLIPSIQILLHRLFIEVIKELASGIKPIGKCFWGSTLDFIQAQN